MNDLGGYAGTRLALKTKQLVIAQIAPGVFMRIYEAKYENGFTWVRTLEGWQKPIETYTATIQELNKYVTCTTNNT